MLRLGRVQGQSMHPTLRPGDHVLAVGLAPGELPAVGEIVWLEKNAPDGSLLGVEIHRVVRVAGGQVVTQGDANGAVDAPPGPNDRLRGRIVARKAASGGPWQRARPWVGRLLTWPMAWRSVRWRRAVQIPLGIFAWHSIFSGLRGRVYHTMTTPAKHHAESNDPIEVQQLGDEYAVYDDRTGAVHILNATAGLIFSQVRSGLDTEGVVQHLHTRFPSLNTAALRSDIAATLAELRALKLID